MYGTVSWALIFHLDITPDVLSNALHQLFHCSRRGQKPCERVKSSDSAGRCHERIWTRCIGPLFDQNYLHVLWRNTVSSSMYRSSSCSIYWRKREGGYLCSSRPTLHKPLYNIRRIGLAQNTMYAHSNMYWTCSSFVMTGWSSAIVLIYFARTCSSTFGLNRFAIGERLTLFWWARCLQDLLRKAFSGTRRRPSNFLQLRPTLHSLQEKPSHRVSMSEQAVIFWRLDLDKKYLLKTVGYYTPPAYIIWYR